MIRRPPRSTRTDTLFPTRRASDLVADRRIQRVEPCFAMLGGTQAHENGEIEAQRARVEDRDAPRDHAAFLEPLHPPPAGILRHVRLGGARCACQRRSAERRIRNECDNPCGALWLPKL